MAGEIENFGDKKNANGFDKNPQNINKEGRPKKSFALFNEKMKSEGVVPLSRSQLIEAYGIIFNSSEEKLRSIASDAEQPYALRIIIMEMNDKKTKAKALADYRDYMFGKATQTVDQKTVHEFEGDPFEKIRINAGIINTKKDD